jgi:hypothetical protein
MKGIIYLPAASLFFLLSACSKPRKDLGDGYALERINGQGVVIGPHGYIVIESIVVDASSNETLIYGHRVKSKLPIHEGKGKGIGSGYFVLQKNTAIVVSELTREKLDELLKLPEEIDWANGEVPSVRP